VSGESSVSEEPGANFLRHFRMMGSIVFSISALFIVIFAGRHVSSVHPKSAKAIFPEKYISCYVISLKVG
jgi:Na+/H+ antiporter NhaC